MQAFFLVADDVMDSSVTRRGQPCWYKKVRELFLEWGVKLYSNQTVEFCLQCFDAVGWAAGKASGL